MTLYDLTADYMALQEMMEDDISDDALLDSMESIEGLYEDKIDGYAAVIRTLEAEATAYKEEADRMANKAKVIRNNINRMKNAMYESMLQTGIRKVKGKRFTVAIQKNGGKAPFVLTWDNPNTLPDELVERKPNIEAIREFTEKNGETYGYFAERGESLRIK